MELNNSTGIVTDHLAIAAIFANDELIDMNRGVMGYDNSPEVRAAAKVLNDRIHKEFLESMNNRRDTH